MTDLKEIKQAIVAYGLHSSFLREWSKPGLSVAEDIGLAAAKVAHLRHNQSAGRESSHDFKQQTSNRILLCLANTLQGSQWHDKRVRMGKKRSKMSRLNVLESVD